MQYKFYIIEDDPVIIRILKNIIHEYHLGEIVGYAYQYESVLSEIHSEKPDIIIVDFLMPEKNGLELISEIQSRGMGSKFIMLSEVSHKEVVQKAYKLGVEHYINKPINVVEVVAVIQKIQNNIKNEKLIELLGLSRLETKKETKEATNDEIDDRFSIICGDLGIYGQKGLENLREIIYRIADDRKQNINIDYKLNDLYAYCVDKSAGTIKEKTIEQRIRRIAITSMSNIAALGIDDYLNYKFERYSTSLFNYMEVKKEMDYMQKKSKIRGKINIKRFIEGVANFCIDY